MTHHDALEREQCRRFLQAFGRSGFGYYLAGLTYEQAAAKHRDAGLRIHPTLEDNASSDHMARAARRWQTNKARRAAGLPPVAQTAPANSTVDQAGARRDFCPAPTRPAPAAPTATTTATGDTATTRRQANRARFARSVKLPEN